ncbi:hypothetical protein Cgig2_029485 [Carnegiea gigantea]|uniref:RNase H type-1 domain-containing protein n=1 Tax=Carnegiea gigantea TaxID=171969 RepID=A0A9Q1KLT1_9CARY|nr:hypothetical protein Cgig2_029485 [Carnegiea gigantea]
MEVSQMIIDEAQVLIPGGEVFKCKYVGKIENREVEKVRVVQNTSGEDSSTDVERLSPRVVFLSETKKSKVDMELTLNRKGRSGGLALLWDRFADLQFLSSSFHHIDVTIQWSINEPVCRFLGIYGWTKTQYKLRIGKLVCDLKPNSPLPWLVGGDLNKIFNNVEKGGVNQIPTWSRFGRLSRIVIYMHWIFRDMILLGGMDKGTFVPWRRGFFGNVRVEIKKLEAQLKGTVDARSRKNILTSIGEWRKREEVLWWQRARIDFLKYGNSNTRWFHSRASMRRARNHIDGLLNADNILCGSLEMALVILPMPIHLTDLKVSDLIETQSGSWHESMLCEILMPCDVEAILDVPLCDSWPSDKLVWHFTASGDFMIQLTYHLILNHRLCDTGFHPTVPRSYGGNFGPSKYPQNSGNIAKRVPAFDMGCAICGASEDSDVHALLHCPLARTIWEGSKVDSRFWDVNVRTMVDCFQEAVVNMGVDEVGEFLAILEHQGLHEGAAPDAHVLWKPPAPGCFKLNFDGGKTSASGRGCGIVIRSCDGDIIFAGVDQGGGFAGPEVEEARACLFGFKFAYLGLSVLLILVSKLL